MEPIRIGRTSHGDRKKGEKSAIVLTEKKHLGSLPFGGKEVQEKKIDGLQGTQEASSSRQFAFVKPSAVFRARSREFMQFMTMGGVLFFLLSFSFWLGHLFLVEKKVRAEFATVTSRLLTMEASLRDFHFSEGGEELDRIISTFAFARQDLALLNPSELSILQTGGALDGVAKTLEAGETIAGAGKTLVMVLENLHRLSEDISTLSREEVVQKYQSITTYPTFQLALVKEAKAQLSSGLALLDRVDPVLFPQDVQEKIARAKIDLRQVEHLLERTITTAPLVLDLLGDAQPRTYVVLLQNDAEMRPTGGFLGSFLLVGVNDGWITRMEFKDIYDVAGQTGLYLPAPRGLSELTSHFGLQDANYAPDFGDSAKQFLWLWDKSKGETLDGVFALNTEVVRDFLGLTGPVPLPGYGIALDQQNFSQALSLLVEAKVEGKEPKKVLGAFIDAFKPLLLEKARSPEFLSLLVRLRDQKYLLGYSSRPKIQAFIEEIHIAGVHAVPAEGEDFLSVVHTSIGGNKSDFYVQQEVEHTTEIIEGGRILNRVVIQKTHTWNAEKEEEIRALAVRLGVKKWPPELVRILGAGANRTYTRVYVPRGSRLILQEGQEGEITTADDDAYTIFSFTWEVEAGAKKAMVLTYELPFRMDAIAEYRFFTEKALGERPYAFVKGFENTHGTFLSMGGETGVRTEQDTVLFPSLLEDRLTFLGVVKP